MAYRLKRIHYNQKPVHILLQNENGPCPLLAAANSLLLRGDIELPSNIVGANVITIDQLVNILAERILSSNVGGGTNNDANADHHIQEVLNVFPNLQFGMDVNPKFTCGPTGVEYTMQLNAFDLLRVELVHGWLLEPDADEYDLVSNQSYNQLINTVIQGNDAADQLQLLQQQQQQQSDTDNNNNSNNSNMEQLSDLATKGTLVRHFLDRSSHQLTQYGLTTLHEYLKHGQIVVFFRNNHFNTLCKHYDGLLYLLVTDLGYADVPTVVWEKLDVIDGDTEYVTGDFQRPPPMPQQQMMVASAAATGEQLVANNLQSQADYQLALQLSRETSSSAINNTNTNSSAGQTPATTTTTQQNHDPDLQAAMQASLLQQYPGPMSSTTTTPILSGGTSANPTSTSTTTATMATLPSSSNTATGSSTTSTTITSPQSQPQQHQHQIPNVAVGIPASQEERDHYMAMQIQRQEEEERTQRLLQEEQASRNMAKALNKRDRHVQRNRVSRPGPPPRPQPTAPPRNNNNNNNNGNNSGCVIS